MSYLPHIVTYIVYFAIILFMGYWASKRTKNLSDFVLGGRSLNGPIAALGAGASDMSGWLMLGLPGAVFVSGVSQIWLPIGLSLGAYINWLFVAKRLRVYTEVANDSLTIPAYFENRFHDDSGLLRTVTGLVIILFFTIYASAGFVGGGILFESTFDIDYHTALWISASFLIIYTSIGGFLAVNWVDFFQGTLMLFALICVPIITALHLGGFQESFTKMQNLHLNYQNIFGNLKPIGIISLIAWGLGYFGQPHILVRFMAAKDSSVLPLARRICMSWMILSLTGAIAVGLIGAIYFADGGLDDPETIFIMLSETLFNPWIAGILLAAVLSALMSTIAAQLLASASSLTEDIYHRFFRKNASQKELLWISRSTVATVAGVAIFLALDPNSTVLTLIGYAWAGLGAAFGPVVLFSLFWKRTTRNSALAGIIFGAIGVVSFKNLSYLGGFWKIYEIVPGFLAASIAIVLVSLLDKKPSDKILEEFERATL